MAQPRILLVVGGGIAAYKACELVRLIRKGGGAVTCVLTEGGKQFVTPMALAALSENPVHTTLWDLRNEVEMGHIQLSREADLVVVCPATADLLAKMAAGIADDLATTLILATDKPVMAVPAMNVRMWLNEATQRNVSWLRKAGVTVIEPDEGAMACGEYGPGRLPEPEIVWLRIQELLDPEHDGTERDYAAPSHEPDAAPPARTSLGSLLSSLIPRSPRSLAFEDEAREEQLAEPAREGPMLATKGAARAAPPTDPDAINHEVNPNQSPPEGLNQPLEDPLDGQPDFASEPEHRPLFGRHLLVTAGPTHEPIDPVRYIANRSSGKQGFAIAGALAQLGAQVTLVSGPVNLPTPPGVDRIDVETAREMADAVRAALPVDAAVMVAAVADWRTEDVSGQKMKKRSSAPPALRLVENPDILASLGASPDRPGLLIGFAAETEDVINHATAKRLRKGADWIVANDVSGDVMGGAHNRVHIVSEDGVDSWDNLPKEEVAMRLAEKIADALQ
jgi:phosphopantothenoylcysteine decarboxylase/phosphopantothenate--cysteine ligase